MVQLGGDDIHVRDRGVADSDMSSPETEKRRSLNEESDGNIEDRVVTTEMMIDSLGGSRVGERKVEKSINCSSPLR
jgi:hypothetical protein